MTTSGHGQNSHNIQYLSQGDTIYYIRKPNQGRQVVTISDICHKVVVTISDIYCTVLPRVLVAQISHDCERPTEMKPSLYELIYDLPIHDFFGQLFLVRRLCVYKYLLVLLTALVTRICSQSVCASYYILGLSWALEIITLLSPSIMPRTALNKILL